jgi:hypothetical protein
MLRPSQIEAKRKLNSPCTYISLYSGRMEGPHASTKAEQSMILYEHEDCSKGGSRVRK